MPQKTPEPFGYFRQEPFGWTDCADTDEGAKPLYDQETVDELVMQREELLEALDVVSEAITRAHAGCANVASGAHCNEARQLARASLRNLDTALSAVASVKGSAA